MHTTQVAIYSNSYESEMETRMSVKTIRYACVVI